MTERQERQLSRIKKLLNSHVDLLEMIKHMLYLQIDLFDVDVICYASASIIRLLRENADPQLWVNVMQYDPDMPMIENEVGMFRITLEDPGVTYHVRFVQLRGDDSTKFQLVATPKKDNS